MEIEIQGIPQSLKTQYQTRMRTAKADLARYKKQSKDLQSQLALLSSSNRGGAGTPTSDEPYGSTSDRTRLLSGTALLEDGSRRLNESQRIALETEDQGAEILMSLRRQREQIENSRDVVCRPLIMRKGDSLLTSSAASQCGQLNRPGIWDIEKDDKTVGSFHFLKPNLRFI